MLSDPYSDTATLPNSKMFAPVVDIFLEVEELKKDIAKSEALIIFDQLGQMFIPHSMLMDRLMIHSKSQLTRIREKYDEIDLTKNIVEEFDIRLGGPYGEFLKHSVMPFLHIRLDLLSKAMNGLGCDEELMVEVFSLCSSSDLANLKYGVSAQVNKGVTREKIIGKTKRGSQLQHFFLSVLDTTRDEEGPPDNELALKQMTHIHEIATNIKTRNPHEYLEVILTCSRAQCAAINEAYMKEHNFSLESSILSVFRGMCGRAITLWTMSLTDAVVYQLKSVMDDTTFRDGDDTVLSVARLISLRNKSELPAVEEGYLSVAGEKLSSALDSFMFGNIRSAIFKRFENNYIDDGAEVKMIEYVKTNGGTMYSTFVDGHSIAQMTGFLTDIKAKYSAYLAKNDPNAVSAKNNMSSKVVEVAHESKKGTTFGMMRESSAGTFTVADRQRYKEKFAKLSDFLREQFRAHDYDRSGSLDSVEFWAMMTELDLGLSARDIEDIKVRSDWDSDGHITFEEASHELVDIVMNLMQKQGRDVNQEVDRLSAARDAEDATIDKVPERSSSVDDEYVPPNLQKYLKASFDAYDVDKSGFLDKDEFWKFIRSIFTDAFTDYDIMQMQVISSCYICVVEEFTIQTRCFFRTHLT